MNTPEQDRSIASRVVRILKRIPDQVGHFVMHSSGDFGWGHESFVGLDVERAESFHPRKRIKEVLNSCLTPNTLGIGMLVVTYIAVYKIEESLGWSNKPLTQLFSVFFPTPGR